MERNENPVECNCRGCEAAELDWFGDMPTLEEEIEAFHGPFDDEPKYEGKRARLYKDGWNTDEHYQDTAGTSSWKLTRKRQHRFHKASHRRGAIDYQIACEEFDAHQDEDDLQQAIMEALCHDENEYDFGLNHGYTYEELDEFELMAQTQYLDEWECGDAEYHVFRDLEYRYDVGPHSSRDMLTCEDELHQRYEYGYYGPYEDSGCWPEHYHFHDQRIDDEFDTSESFVQREYYEHLADIAEEEEALRMHNIDVIGITELMSDDRRMREMEAFQLRLDAYNSDDVAHAEAGRKNAHL